MLVNNAGNFYAGFFEEISPQDFRAQIETTLFGPINVTRAVLPLMRAQRAGLVVAISSTAGIVGQEFCTAYAASKFAVEGWIESLTPEVAPFGILTMLVEPGFFRTELLTPESTSYAVASIDDYAERTEQTVAAWKGMNGQQGGDPAKLAHALVQLAGQHEPPLRFAAGADAPMESKLAGTAALVTGASSGIGAATARLLAVHGASIALVARRKDRLQALAAEIHQAGGTALVVEADITDRTQAEAAVQQTVERFGRLDTLINNAGLMLLGPVDGADVDEWERMIAVNVKGLLHTTHAALPHLLHAAEQGPRRVADIVNVSSIAGRVAWNGYAVYNLTKFAVNGFTESLRQEVTQRHVRVGLVEPGGVATELGSHNKPEIRNEMIDPFYEQTEVLAPEDIADGVAYMVTRPRPRHTAIGELWIMPTDQV